MEEIKQRLFQVLQRHSDSDFPRAVVEVLCRDALAEIDKLDKGAGWMHFLRVRASLIDEFCAEGKSHAQIARTLSMSAEQVRLIAARAK